MAEAAAPCPNAPVSAGDPAWSPRAATSSARSSDSLPELPTPGVTPSTGLEDGPVEPSGDETSSAVGSASAAMASAKRSPLDPDPVAWARLVAKSSPLPAASPTAEADEPVAARPGDCCSSARVCSMSANETGLMVIAA